MQRNNQINRLVDFLVILENAHVGDTEQWLAEFTDAQLRHYEDTLVREHGGKLGMQWDASTGVKSDGGLNLQSTWVLDERVSVVHGQASGGADL